MTKDYDEHWERGLPRAAWDYEHFHHSNWTKFVAKCVPTWLQMSIPQKRIMVRKFILNKFTLDPKHLCMNPRVGEKRKLRNDASWPGFWLSDEEFDDIVTRVMSAYEDHHRKEVARAFESGGGTTTAAPF